MDGFRIREASLGDRDAVLAINDNIYDGLDYLTGLFDYFMTCSNAKGYVGDLNGEIIAFGISFLVDDDYTVISRSGRVSPKHAGQGIYSLLQKHVLKSSGAVENSFTTLNINPAVALESFRRDNKLIVTKDMRRYTVNLKQVPLELSADDAIKQVTDNDLQTYMNSDFHRKYLFPHDVIVVDWVPYRLLPSNIPLMGVPGRTNMITNVKVGGVNQTGLLSFLTVTQTQDPPFCLVLDIYGSDACAIDMHIAAQFNFARKHTTGTVCCLVLYDEHLCRTSVEQSFTGPGMTNEDWKLLSDTDLPELKQMVFRKAVI